MSQDQTYLKEALDVIAFNEMTPETLMNKIMYSTKQSADTHKELKDDSGTTWVFMIRHRGHPYLMAKHPLIDRYIEVMKKIKWL
jgi:hypothetical protein